MSPLWLLTSTNNLAEPLHICWASTGAWAPVLRVVLLLRRKEFLLSRSSRSSAFSTDGAPLQTAALFTVLQAVRSHCWCCMIAATGATDFSANIYFWRFSAWTSLPSVVAASFGSSSSALTLFTVSVLPETKYSIYLPHKFYTIIIYTLFNKQFIRRFFKISDIFFEKQRSLSDFFDLIVINSFKAVFK